MRAIRQPDGDPHGNSEGLRTAVQTLEERISAIRVEIKSYHNSEAPATAQRELDCLVEDRDYLVSVLRNRIRVVGD